MDIHMEQIVKLHTPLRDIRNKHFCGLAYSTSRIRFTYSHAMIGVYHCLAGNRTVGGLQPLHLNNGDPEVVLHGYNLTSMNVCNQGQRIIL